jgi:ATP-dependent DNA helicase RecQ
LTDKNPALDLLNAFCLFYLGTNNNETLETELQNTYREGLFGFAERIDNLSDFWSFFDKYNQAIAEKARDYPPQQFDSMKNKLNLELHTNIISKITNKYTEK